MYDAFGVRLYHTQPAAHLNAACKYGGGTDADRLADNFSHKHVAATAHARAFDDGYAKRNFRAHPSRHCCRVYDTNDCPNTAPHTCPHRICA